MGDGDQRQGNESRIFFSCFLASKLILRLHFSSLACIEPDLEVALSLNEIWKCMCKVVDSAASQGGGEVDYLVNKGDGVSGLMAYFVTILTPDSASLSRFLPSILLLVVIIVTVVIVVVMVILVVVVAIIRAVIVITLIGSSCHDIGVDVTSSS
ncbi:hypothetical protein Tco_0093639 [Tanacetum coccineum]